MFTDLLVECGWHYVVRVQAQTRCRDRCGREQPTGHLARYRGRRAKLRGWAFKKRGWREASMVVHHGRRHKTALCLVSDLPPDWSVLHLYRKRFAIETLFRDFKSAGWEWEQGQVTDLDHILRWLVGMALATWAALCAGTQVASALLARTPTGRRHTPPWQAKRSLFSLGLDRLHHLLDGSSNQPLDWRLTDWNAPVWHDQLWAHHAHPFIFAPKVLLDC